MFYFVDAKGINFNLVASVYYWLSSLVMHIMQPGPFLMHCLQ